MSSDLSALLDTNELHEHPEVDSCRRAEDEPATLQRLNPVSLRNAAAPKYILLRAVIKKVVRNIL